MKKTLKKYFIPHAANDHKPYVLREKVVLGVVFTGVLLLCASLLGSYVVKNTKFLASIQSAFLVDLANEDRADEGTQALVMNEKLVYAAQLKANDMAEKSYFAHTSPEGLTPWHWFGEAEYDYLYAGENLAVNFNRSEDVERAWMNSPLHRANILNARYKEIGIATAEGTYKGKRTTFVVQMFGTPLSGSQGGTQPAQEVAVVTTIPDTQVVSNTLPEEVEGESITRVASPQVIPQTQNKNSAEVKQIIAEPKENLVDELAARIPSQDVAGTSDVQMQPTYTNWFERLLVSPEKAINNAYGILFVLILGSLLLNIFIAIKKQHPKSIAYGILLLVLILIFMYINREMFVDPIVAAFV